MYVKRQEYELMLLHYISEEFAVIDARFDAFTKKNNAKKTDKKKKKKKKEEVEEELGKVKSET